MINVTFNTPYGQSLAGVLSDNITLQEFRSLIERLSGKEALTEWSYLCKGKPLRIDDETLFNAQKKLITNGCTIHYVQRMRGDCFLSDTVVSLSDGTKKIIGEVRVGDTLLAFDVSRTIITATVKEVSVRDVDDYVELCAGQTVVRATPEHCFLNGSNTFSPLHALQINDCIYRLVNHTLQPTPITNIKSIHAPGTHVYKLIVDPFTFFANGFAVKDGC
jgi:hypothetical protein